MSVVAAGNAFVMNDETGELSIQGTLADVNATLGSLSYTVPSTDFNDTNNPGDVLVSIEANDLGNTGSGGATLTLFDLLKATESAAHHVLTLCWLALAVLFVSVV